jgi:hypothetical protein
MELSVNESFFRPTIDQVLSEFRSRFPEYTEIINSLEDGYLRAILTQEKLAHTLGALFGRADVAAVLTAIELENRAVTEIFLANVMI